MQTYHTLQDMRVVFLDGTVLDTADPASREAFLKVRTPCPHFGLAQGWRGMCCLFKYAHHWRAGIF